MIMASSHRRSWETVLVENPRWKRGNIGYIDPAEPLKMINGRQHCLIHWENSSYDAQYVDCLYVCKMEDISNSKHTRFSPDEVRISPEQRVSLEGLQKDRALGRRLFKESSSQRRRIVEENETLELSIDPFAEVPPEETGQKRSPKPLPQHEVPLEETGQKRSPKPLLQQRQQAAEKRSTKRPLQEAGVRLQAVEKSSRKPPPLERLRLQTAQERSPQPPPQERLRLQGGQERLCKPPPTRLLAAQKRSSQVVKEDIQASKPLLEGSKKSPTLQETSKQSSWRRWLITEEDDELFSCNVDPFSEELVDQFEAQDKNKAAESDQSSQENCF